MWCTLTLTVRVVKCRSHRESLGEIFVQVLEMILEAEPGTPYAGIKTSNVVDFLLQLTKPVQNVSVDLFPVVWLTICDITHLLGGLST